MYSLENQPLLCSWISSEYIQQKNVSGAINRYDVMISYGKSHNFSLFLKVIFTIDLFLKSKTRTKKKHTKRHLHSNQVPGSDLNDEKQKWAELRANELDDGFFHFVNFALVAERFLQTNEVLAAGNNNNTSLCAVRNKSFYQRKKNEINKYKPKKKHILFVHFCVYFIFGSIFIIYLSAFQFLFYLFCLYSLPEWSCQSLYRTKARCFCMIFALAKSKMSSKKYLIFFFVEQNTQFYRVFFVCGSEFFVIEALDQLWPWISRYLWNENDWI